MILQRYKKLFICCFPALSSLLFFRGNGHIHPMCALAFGLYARVGCAAPGLQFAGSGRMTQSGQLHVVGHGEVGVFQ